MTSRYWLRSSVFNIVFYISTALACILFLPTLLMPRRASLAVIHGWTGFVGLIEKTMLGLRFEIRGLEHLPASGSYIVAAKHQSPYETFKLHTLFGDPAIILKQELLKIPLWGAYLKAADPIAIDRSDPDSAIDSIQSGAKRVKAQGRPIVIFPQGTRVWPHQSTSEKPYKIGVARIQEATNLPIIPMALNTGYFWPREGLYKRPGRVVFEFLPPVQPGLPREKLMETLQTRIEEKSNDLMQEAVLEEKKRKTTFVHLAFGAALLFFALYSAWWFWLAGQVKTQHTLFLKTDAQLEQFQGQAVDRMFENPRVSGYPLKMTLSVDKEDLRLPTAAITAYDFKAQSWPFPNFPVTVETGRLDVRDFRMAEALSFDSFTSRFRPAGKDLVIDYATVQKNDLLLNIAGTIHNVDSDMPEVDLILTARNYAPFVQEFVQAGMMDARSAGFVLAGLRGLEQEDGIISIPLTSQNGKLYLGPFLIGDLRF